MKKRYLLVMVMVLLLITSMALIVACDNKDKDPIDEGGSGIIDDGGNNGGGEALELADISQYLTYELNEDGNSYTVTGLTEEGYNLVRLDEGYTPQKSKLIIPSQYLDKPVTTISSNESGDYPLFSYSIGLVSVVIPDSVTSIGDYAFVACYSLIEVYNKSSLNIVAGSEDNGFIGYYARNVYTEERESKLSIDENGFIIYKENNDKILVGCLDKYTYLNIPSSVTKINQGAFCNNKDIVMLTIPESVTYIGEAAFFSCYCLKEIYNKSSLDIVVGSREHGYVGYNAKNIYKTETESKLNIDENGYIIYSDGTNKLLVKYVGEDSILTLPSGITEISRYALFANKNINSITIPNSLFSIYDYAFVACNNLKSIYFQGTITQWEAMNKEYFWDYGLENYTIHCTDGDIAKE